MLEHGIPHTDFLTIHQNLHFVMQQWGFSVIIYFFYHHLGSMGVFFLLGFINLLIIYFLYRLCMIHSSNNRYYSCLFASVIDVILELAFIIPRPQIISMLLFIITLFLLERHYYDSLDNTSRVKLLEIINNCKKDSGGTWTYEEIKDYPIAFKYPLQEENPQGLCFGDFFFTVQSLRM